MGFSIKRSSRLQENYILVIRSILRNAITYKDTKERIEALIARSIYGNSNWLKCPARLRQYIRGYIGAALVDLTDYEVERRYYIKLNDEERHLIATHLTTNNASNKAISISACKKIFLFNAVEMDILSNVFHGSFWNIKMRVDLKKAYWTWKNSPAHIFVELPNA